MERGRDSLMNKEEFIEGVKNLEIPLILGFNYRQKKFSVLNLTSDNKDLKDYDITAPENFQKYIDNVMKKQNTEFAIGKYDEDRTIYRSELFGGKEKRTIHLGLDIWVRPGIKVLSPFNGRVHSFANNSSKGDYGGTIILEYKLKNKIFWVLFGHLSLRSLEGLYEGKAIRKGEAFAEIGQSSENGFWPPHLHLQIILDLLGKKGDFFGVASQSERRFFLSICPNPNLILNINGL
jgi:murein DD-endopeptidase MepM/ murein hydrolase activator NlpD